jgi:hypothetical protein
MAKLAVPIRHGELMSELSHHPRTSKIPVPCQLAHALNAVMAIRPPHTPIAVAWGHLLPSTVASLNLTDIKPSRKLLKLASNAGPNSKKCPKSAPKSPNLAPKSKSPKGEEGYMVRSNEEAEI